MADGDPLDDSYDLAQPLSAGSTATPITAAANEPSWPVATIWLPDPAERRGWFVWRVERKKDETRRKLGY